MPVAGSVTGDVHVGKLPPPPVPVPADVTVPPIPEPPLALVPPLSEPLPFFAYPFLVLTMLGWAWSCRRPSP